MALNANKVPKTGGSKQEVLEAGVYPARLVQVIDLGLQPQLAWQGKDKPPAYQISLTYELVDEFMKDENGEDMEDKPRWISEIVNLFPLEADKAKSTLRYLALDPEQVHEGDFSQLVGIPCNATLIVEEKKGVERNKVAGISAMRPRDAAKCPELVNEPRVFDLDDPDMEVFNILPDWLKGKITENLEFTGSPLEEALGGKKEKPAKASKKKEEEEEPAFDPDEEDEEIPY